MRNPGIELYRCLLMFGICLLHVVGFYQEPKAWGWLSHGLLWCVPGFVFITGFFGCRFDWKKILKLYGVALWCFPLIQGIGLLVDGGTFSCSAWLGAAWRDFLGNWFLHAYVILLVLAPYVDALLEPVRASGDVRQALRLVGPLALLVFGWSYLVGYNCTEPFIPRSHGLHPYSGLTLVGVYALARVVRFCNLHERIPTWGAGTLFGACVALSMLKLGFYNSLIAFGAAFAGFVLCWRLPLPPSVGRACCFLGPSMFSVFLLHTNGWVLPSIKGWLRYLVQAGVPLVAAFILLAGLIFVCGVLLDLPRRVLRRRMVGL